MTKPEQRSMALGSQSKIRADHLQRLSYIYIRQSSAKQVEQHRESQLNQRQLVERAEALGWHRDRIRVINVDQGLSGKGSDYRQGFQELVAELSLGQVGIVFGFDASRLARNNRDWYHLLDLAAMFGTLIGDCDGIYDPRLYNDRLLLGLKGTMSEAELHLLHERLDSGRMSQVMRGEFRQALPTGLVRLPDHSVVKDPDDQVRHVIEFVFAKFDEMGSCGKVMRYFRDQNVLLPRRHTTGIYSGQLIWRSPSAPMIRTIICNPAYAGAFAFGRRQVDPARRRPDRPHAGMRHAPIEDWIHLQQDVSRPTSPGSSTWLTNSDCTKTPCVSTRCNAGLRVWRGKESPYYRVWPRVECAATRCMSTTSATHVTYAPESPPTLEGPCACQPTARLLTRSSCNCSLMPFDPPNWMPWLRFWLGNKQSDSGSRSNGKNA